MKGKIDQREDFCGACVAGVAALVGAGAAGSTAGDRKNNKKRKKIIFWIGISITIVSILVAIYFLFIKKCEECA